MATEAQSSIPQKIRADLWTTYFEHVERTYKASFTALRSAIEKERPELRQVAVSSGSLLTDWSLRIEEIGSYISARYPLQDIPKLETEFDPKREQHEVKRAYQKILLADAKTQILHDITAKEIENFSQDNYTDPHNENNSEYIAQMNVFLKRIEAIQKVFYENRVSLHGIATDLIHVLDKGTSIGPGLSTGYNLITGKYPDRYGLNTLISQDPLGDYIPSPTDSPETVLDSSSEQKESVSFQQAATPNPRAVKGSDSAKMDKGLRQRKQHSNGPTRGPISKKDSS